MYFTVSAKLGALCISQLEGFDFVMYLSNFPRNQAIKQKIKQLLNCASCEVQMKNEIHLFKPMN